MLDLDALNFEGGITFYNDEGRITNTIAGGRQIVESIIAQTNESWIEGVFSSKTHYIEGGKPRERMPVPVVVNGLTLTGLPDACMMVIDGTQYEAHGPLVELEFDQPGTYHVRVESWPYLDTEVTVEN